MFHIIGADGIEYGPVTADILRQWIAQKRANAQTRVRYAGSTEWRSLASLPEFAAEFGIHPGSQATPPPSSTFTSAPQFHNMAAADAMAREVLAQNRTFSIGDSLSKAWDLMVAHFWPALGAGAIILLLTSVAGAIGVVSLLFTYVLFGGLDYYYLKLLRGERAEIGDVFSGFTIAFVPLMLLSVVLQLLVGLGFLLCILPGIYLAVVWSTFTALLVIDKKLDFWPAMELSRKVLHRQWWHMFLFLIVLFIIGLGGALLLCVGIFITFTLTTISTVVAYEQLFGGIQPPLALAGPQPMTPAGGSPGPVVPPGASPDLPPSPSAEPAPATPSSPPPQPPPDAPPPVPAP